MTLEERDAKALWHPATHFRDLEETPPIAISRALGSWLYDERDRAILDGISSWWTCLHGHGHPTIQEAIKTQVSRLDHVMFAGFTHEPGVALAEQLLHRAPPGYGKVFYSDCGSASIEVALKLSYQSRIQRGEPKRRRFAALHNSYHGETLGALSVCGHDTYRELFSPLLVDVLYLPAPALANHSHQDLGEDSGATAPETATAIALLERHAEELTAIFIEPIIQCAGKMTMTGSGYYRRVTEAAQRLGIHVIADEIAVGFGRTGSMFASTWSGVTPDLLCLSKGLSGGVLPLAATLIRRGFEDDFKGSPERSFMHSHTFTGNPIACAAGLASLKIFDEEQTIAHLSERISWMESLRHEVESACESVVEHRQSGLVTALRVDPARGRSLPPDGRLGLALRRAALERGVLLRPLHDTIYWMPPLNISRDDLTTLAEVTVAAINTVLG